VSGDVPPPVSGEPSGPEEVPPGGSPEGAAEAGPDRPQPREATGVDLARVALRAAKEAARARGAAAQQKRDVRRGRVPRSGAGRDGRDPVPLGAAVNGLITERGWEAPAAVGGVMGRWPQLVGPEVAQHCEPQRYDEEERTLTVRCDSTAWATQLRLLAPRLVARLNEDLGQGTVLLLKVRGPETGAPRGGRLRAPGSKGPGDTYG
jgi:predicted nucleic acid-binding Zn ribbon protein